MTVPFHVLYGERPRTPFPVTKIIVSTPSVLYPCCRCVRDCGTVAFHATALSFLNEILDMLSIGVCMIPPHLEVFRKMDTNGGGREWFAVFAFLLPHVASYAAPLRPTTVASIVVFVGVNVRV